MQVLKLALEVCLVVRPRQLSRSMLMWWKSAVNLSFFLSFATCRMRSSACDTLTRLCARHVLCWSAFPLVSALGSTGSAAVRSTADRSAAGCFASFAGFTATMTESDFSSVHHRLRLLAFPMRTAILGTHSTLTASHETSQLPMRSFCT